MEHLFSNPIVAFVLFGGTYIASSCFPLVRHLSRQLKWNKLSGVSTNDFVGYQFFWGAGVYAIVLALLNLLGAADGISAVAVLAAGAGGGIAALIDRYFTTRPPSNAINTA
jgi:hypothetical protein